MNICFIGIIILIFAGNLVQAQQNGYAESVLIEGERLYCNPAGKQAFMICLNKKSGKLIWANREIPGTVGFSSPVVGKFAGLLKLINLSSNCIYAIDSKTGTLLWHIEYENQRQNNCSDPIYHNGYVFV